MFEGRQGGFGGFWRSRKADYANEWASDGRLDTESERYTTSARSLGLQQYLALLLHVHNRGIHSRTKLRVLFLWVSSKLLGIVRCFVNSFVVSTLEVKQQNKTKNS